MIMETENIDGIAKILLNAANAIFTKQQNSNSALTVEDIFETLSLFKENLLNAQANVVETRPEVLACDVVRFQNNKDKWVAFVGLLNGHPYEIFTGLQDDDEGILLPKTVTKGKIIKVVNADGSKRYDFQQGILELCQAYFRRVALQNAAAKRYKTRKFVVARKRKHKHLEKRRGTRTQKVPVRRKSGIIQIKTAPSSPGE